MNKIPLWRYIVIIFVVAIAIIYSVPNFYGEVPAVQISSIDNNSIDNNIMLVVNKNLQDNNLNPLGEIFTNNTLKIKFSDTDAQLKARDLIQSQLGDKYIVALNLLSNSPELLHKIHANPMFLGLDLRGGVHFLLSVDVKAAVTKTLAKYAIDIRNDLRNNNIMYGSIATNESNLSIKFRDLDLLDKAYEQVSKDLSNIHITKNEINFSLDINIADKEISKIQEAAVKQNILILHNRVNELGVAEPIIQQQGLDRIVVELPGVQDTARAKDIIGRVATLEVRMVNDDPTEINSANQGLIDSGYELLNDIDRDGQTSKILVNKDVELTGDNIVDAQPGFDENGNPAVNIRLDSIGSSIFKQVTAANIGKRMAMVLIDRGKSEVVTAPVIRTEIGGGQVQISGSMNIQQANDVALLLRSGSLAAPTVIIEERTVGPSLGKDNITKGFNSVLFGFIAITIFMAIYYMIFGLISIVSLATNLLLLVAILSMLQATLTLPGIAAIALALGMAIDSNVLINERIREELRNGIKIHSAIQNGYEHAWATIVDSNITTLIAGLALLAFGSGPIKGFAIVHCLGILTSMFSAVMVSRGIVWFLYAKRKINKLYI
jgi:preprotein translocase subunit SecD